MGEGAQQRRRGCRGRRRRQRVSGSCAASAARGRPRRWREAGFDQAGDLGGEIRPGPASAQDHDLGPASWPAAAKTDQGFLHSANSGARWPGRGAGAAFSGRRFWRRGRRQSGCSGGSGNGTHVGKIGDFVKARLVVGRSRGFFAGGRSSASRAISMDAWSRSRQGRGIDRGLAGGTRRWSRCEIIPSFYLAGRVTVRPRAPDSAGPAPGAETGSPPLPVKAARLALSSAASLPEPVETG